MFSRLLAGLKRSRKDAEVFFGLVDRPGWGGQRTGKINIPPAKKTPAPHDPRNIIRPWNLFIFSILDVIWNGSKENE